VKFSECYRGSGVPPLFRSTSGGTPLLPYNELRKGDAWKYNDDFGTCIGSAHRRSNAAATPQRRNAAATPLQRRCNAAGGRAIHPDFGFGSFGCRAERLKQDSNMVMNPWQNHSIVDFVLGCLPL